MTDMAKVRPRGAIVGGAPIFPIGAAVLSTLLASVILFFPIVSACFPLNRLSQEGVSIAADGSVRRFLGYPRGSYVVSAVCRYVATARNRPCLDSPFVDHPGARN